MNKDILDAEIQIPGFKLFRRDRNFVINSDDIDTISASSGGGSIIYIKTCLNPVELDWFEVCDSVAVQFDSNIGRVNIACVYRSISLNQNQNDTMLNMLTRLVCEDMESVVVGDFNLPNVSWPSRHKKQRISF